MGYYALPPVESVEVMDNNENSPMEFKNSGLFKRFQSLRNFFHDPASLTQIIKFCGVGILNTIVGYGAFFLLVNYLYYLVALFIAHIIGVIHSFLWNKYWVFKTKKFNLWEFIKFNLIYAVVFIVNAVALFVCVDIMYVDPKLAQLLLLPIITVVSFFGQKLWTFKGKVREN
jgi:putative flippase GtrA